MSDTANKAKNIPDAGELEELIVESDIQVPPFDTEDEEEDEKIWQAKFAATPADKLNRLVEKVRSDIRAGKVKPLDFTDK